LYAAKKYRDALAAYQDIIKRFDDALSKVMLEQCQTKMTIEV
jgi:hypothetical protein